MTTVDDSMFLIHALLETYRSMGASEEQLLQERNRLLSDVCYLESEVRFYLEGEG